MQRYSRKPAIAILALAMALGGFYAYSNHDLGKAEAAATNGASSAAVAITAPATDAPITAWISYGDALRGAGQYDTAVKAFEHVTEQDASSRPAQVGLILALAQAKQKEDMFARISDMVYSDPKLAQQVMSKPECKAFEGDDRYAGLLKEAKVQEMD